MDVLHNGVELTWLGHSTWLIRSPEGRRILVDPWTDGNPSCPARFKGDGLGPLDLILVTHGHGDHIGDLLPVAQRTGAPVVGIYDLTTWADANGAQVTVGLNKGGTYRWQGIAITLTDAVHSSSTVHEGVSIDLGDPCGLVIRLENGFTIYDTGDTAVFGDMALIAELYEPDLVILPIGDHFTMGPREAAKAVELIGARRVVPNHYGTFPLLTGTPEELRRLVGPGVEVLAVAPGETIR
jgi:L-ascorbate metabolism protein UlaG (beta-lactamase superfamily)